MKINALTSLAALPVLLSTSAHTANAKATLAPKGPTGQNQQRRTARFPGNLTAIANISASANASVAANFSSPIIPLPSTKQICATAFEKHEYKSLASRNPAEVCAQQAISDGRQNLNLATIGYQLAADDALKAGYHYKAALSYSKAAILERTLRKLDDVGLVAKKTNALAGSAPFVSATSAGLGSSNVDSSNEAKAFATFQKIGDYVAVDELRKNLGATAHARFPELSDVEKIERYNFHDAAAWKDVSTPTDFGVLEKTLNSGNVLRLQFSTDLKGIQRLKLAGSRLPEKDDLKIYGNAFVSLIDLSPTFRHRLYELLERNASPDYTLRVNVEQNAKYLGYAPIGGSTQTLFPYHPNTKEAPISLNEVQTTLLHEFGHNVQLGTSKDADGTTVLRLNLGHSHDREQTAFMGGVLNEYNRFLTLARRNAHVATSLDMPIKTNIDRDDYCEDLMLAQPEWIASKGAGILTDTAAALERDEADAALKIFSKIATSDQIDITMYDAAFKRTADSSHVETYNLAEVSLQQLLVGIDRADWFAAEGTAENKSTRAAMGKFLNLLVEQGPTDANDPDWRTTINGAFNYLSMDPKVEVPGYAYADRYPGGATSDVPEAAKPARGSESPPKSLLAVMAVMSIVIAGFGLRVAKTCRDERAASVAGRDAVAPAIPPEQEVPPALPV
ncbi:MAG: hypothetical protein H7234_08955 [Herminiimonas sp.]|nr:hypothetical protein [Herminiimonas sp.]